VARRAISGILILDKPKGITSNAALQRVKRLYNAAKAGHSGSLDPVATGLLPICLGEATKFSRFLLDADKHYRVSANLGIRTETGDTEGKVISTGKVDCSLTTLQSVLENFRGNILQVPSMYSAIKYQGQPLYKLARQGITVDREAREISIYSLEILSFSENILELEVHASKGTYIRSLVDDIGEALGCGAHVLELRRLKAGPYIADQMLTLETLEQVAESEGIEALDRFLLPVESAVASMPDVKLSDSTAFYIGQGQAVIVPHAPANGWVRLKNGEHFLGIGEILEDGRVTARRLTNKVVSF